MPRTGLALRKSRRMASLKGFNKRRRDGGGKRRTVTGREKVYFSHRMNSRMRNTPINGVLIGPPLLLKSPLRWFQPYISSDRLISLGGRLRHSAKSEDFKHPIVLRKGHRLTRLLVEQYHERLLHSEPQLLLSTIRLKYC